jgi:hypothetical protein
MPLVFVSDMQECYRMAVDLLTGPGPVFLSRIGGSDTDAVIDYFAAVLAASPANIVAERVLPHKGIITQFNGYYDKDKSDEKLLRFCAELLDLYRQCNRLSICQPDWLTTFFPESLHPTLHVSAGDKGLIYRDLLNSIADRQGNVSLWPYTFIERIVEGQWTLFRAFAEALSGLRVLVVSPFACSITTNFRQRKNFFKKYDYPEFELLTLNVPITYSGLPDNHYPDHDWFATSAALQQKIRQTEFDVALLGCGSYAMPLGVFIEQTMRRKSVFVGGVLQLFFGLLGRRYLNPYFLDQINAEYFIRPLEAANYRSQVNVAEGYPRDAFGAYF